MVSAYFSSCMSIVIVIILIQLRLFPILPQEAAPKKPKKRSVRSSPSLLCPSAPIIVGLSILFHPQPRYRGNYSNMSVLPVFFNRPWYYKLFEHLKLPSYYFVTEEYGLSSDIQCTFSGLPDCQQTWCCPLGGLVGQAPGGGFHRLDPMSRLFLYRYILDKYFK